MDNIMAPRDAFGKSLYEAGKLNPNIFVVTADLGTATKASIFGDAFKDRYLNVGIAEQNLTGVAAGLARSGYTAVMSTFACFAPGRCYDQIRQSIAYSNLNVKVMSTHPGLSVGMDGAIHQSLDDIALMRELPNFVVLAPSDEIETRKAVLKAIEHEGPVYVRIGRKEVPKLFKEEWDFEIGKGYTLSEGNDVTIIAHGSMVSEAYEAGKGLGEMGISARVINMSSIKPIDKGILVKAALETKGIVVAEDHFKYGGLYSAVCEVVSSKAPTKVLAVAVNDTFSESGKPEDLYKKYGLTKENIIARSMEIINRS